MRRDPDERCGTATGSAGAGNANAAPMQLLLVATIVATHAKWRPLGKQHDGCGGRDRESDEVSRMAFPRPSLGQDGLPCTRVR